MTFYQGTNDRVAVLLPVASYAPNHPVLHYARKVLLARGWSVEEVWWSSDDLASDEAVMRTAKAALDKVADLIT